jgi:hypothetical protein
MESEEEIVKKAVDRLWPYRAFSFGDSEVILAFLLPVPMWRDVRDFWWKGKFASLIGGDWNGNFFLRHSDGTVSYWLQTDRRDTVAAGSVREFIGFRREPVNSGTPGWRDAT